MERYLANRERLIEAGAYDPASERDACGVGLVCAIDGKPRREVVELAGFQHGRCERYFAVHFEADRPRAGELLDVRIERVTAHRTIGAAIIDAR